MCWIIVMITGLPLLGYPRKYHDSVADDISRSEGVSSNLCWIFIYD